MAEEKEKIVNDGLNHIDFKAGTFKAGGKLYRIQGAISVERFCEFQILEKEFALNTSLKGLYDNLVKVLDHMNKLKFVDAAVLQSNIINGVADLELREPKMLRMCALFCNVEGENLFDITEDMITEKVEDFRKSGIDINDFFDLAATIVPSYMSIYEKVTRTISGQLENGAAENQ